MSLTGPGAVNSDTFRAIEARLASFNPPIILSEHLVDKPRSVVDLEVHPLTLQGVDFTAKDPDKFLEAVRKAKNGTDKAFNEGSTKAADWKEHWAMTTSLLATKGIGFREPWRYYLGGHGRQLADARPPGRGVPEMDMDFAGYFGTANTINLSALHISVAFGKWTECNIHIDETGIAMTDLANNLTITPNVASHFANELLLKTIAGEALKLPTWFLDRFNFHFLSPEMGYRRVGVSMDVLKGKTYKLTISASCGLTSCPDIDLVKVIKLDTDALKSINPTVTFTKRF
jgi:hypothetical protein